MNNKNVLVTGCSRGLGSIISKDLNEKGHFVLPHYRTVQSYYDYPLIVGDLRRLETLLSIENALEYHGINVFINNAAIHKRKPFTEHTDEDIESLINVNITSQIKLIKRVYNYFIAIGEGLIINVNSIAGMQPAPEETIYSATKHALKGFSQSLQIESIGKNIKIVDIFPGAMKTDMTKNRENYNTLIDPHEVSTRVCNIVENKNTTSLETEFVIRKFNRG